MNLDLQTLANLAEVFGALTIFGGAVFAVLQIREFRAQRREALAVELTRAFQNPELIRALWAIRALPDGLSAEELRELGPETEQAALMVAFTVETAAILIHQGHASYELMREIAGGLIVVSHRKLQGWVRDVRVENDQPSWAEWYQWLSEQFMRDAASKEANPAHVRYADWRPRT